MDPAVESFTRFVSGASPRLLQAGWLLTGDWQLAQDLVQTSLAATWRRWSSIREPEAATAYVRRAMVRTYASWRSRKWAGEIPAADVWNDNDRIIEDPFALTGTEIVVQRALARLSRQQRATVVLRYFLDLSDSQAATILGCSVAAIKSHTSRALVALRKDATLKQSG